jgi:tetrahydromethanopterin S-methyltransferase subunit G
MEAMAQEWTDGRLDELSAKVDRGFEQVDKRLEQVDKRFEQVDRRFERIDERLDALQHMMAYGFIAMTGAILAGFAGICTLLATQL